MKIKINDEFLENIKNRFNKHFFDFINNSIKKNEKIVSYKNYKDFKIFFEFTKDYLVNGKRLRALAFLLLCNELNKKNIIEKSKIKSEENINNNFFYKNFFDFNNKFYLPAIAIELHHNYSLILDDVMDEDELRRNKPTVYKLIKDYYLKSFSDFNYEGSLFNKKSNKFSVSFAVMLANFVNILSKQAILNSNFNEKIKLDTLSLFEQVDKEIYFGQMLDILFENKNIFDIKEENYIEMVYFKTGVLFGLAFQLSSIFSNKKKISYLLREAGINAAIAFQINDDLLDFSEKKGHLIGSDLRKQKKTLILIKTIENLKLKNKINEINFLLSLNNNSTDYEIKKAINIIKKTGAIDYVSSVMIKYYKKSILILKKTNLENIMSFIDFMLKK